MSHCYIKKFTKINQLNILFSFVTGDDNFGEDTLDETVGDDTEDYSMMEGGTGEEEPQAGTSADGAGEGQGRCFNFHCKSIPIEDAARDFGTCHFNRLRIYLYFPLRF